MNKNQANIAMAILMYSLYTNVQVDHNSTSGTTILSNQEEDCVVTLSDEDYNDLCERFGWQEAEQEEAAAVTANTNMNEGSETL